MLALPILSILLLAALDDEPWIRRGAEVVAPFKTSLQAALKKGLAEGGPKAISVCREQAPKLAQAAGSDTTRVGRTSHKLRNPANAPEPWMEALLEAYEANPDRKAPRVIHLEQGRVGYVEPIYVQAPCLMCHGETIAPAVRQTIETLYPDDRATGFKEGEFRGIFWVEFGPE